MEFTKMHGAGNDFVLLDCRAQAFEGDRVLLCDRHRGIGCDQLIEVHEGTTPDCYSLRFYNQDGSVAGACGNGTRCSAAWLMQQTGLDAINFTIAGRQVPAWRDKEQIWVNMGQAAFDTADIPASEMPLRQVLALQDTQVTEAMVCSMGNPHLVLYSEQGFSDAFVAEQGARLEVHEIFPEQANIGFLNITEQGFALRVWERGVGETLACGSGACAAFAVAQKAGLWSQNSVAVHLPGGVLNVKMQDTDIEMTGPVTFVAEGVWHG